jgi:hypothetical protein
MLSREKLTGYTPIPNFDGYYFNKNMHPCVVIVTKEGAYVRKLKVFNSHKPETAHVQMRNNQGLSKKKVYMKELFNTEPPLPIEKVIPENVSTISMNQMRNRTPLTRDKVVNYLLMERPNVQVPLTPNKDQCYETGRGMKELGMIVCSSCGYIQPLEFKLCKHCSNFITI